MSVKRKALAQMGTMLRVVQAPGSGCQKVRPVSLKSAGDPALVLLPLKGTSSFVRSKNALRLLRLQYLSRAHLQNLGL